MGASGTKLYDDDFASDIRGEYIDKLRRGKTNEEAIQEVIATNQASLGDVEIAPIFWFALADTQWEYGRLTPEVKERAVEFLSRTEELDRWRESGENQLRAWKNTREKLKDKLLSPQPAEKKVSRYRLYKCKWKLGDVFAYRFTSEYSKEKGVFEQYIILRKVTEDTWWPGHIVPSVHIYQWIGKDIPLLNDISNLDLLPQKFWPIAYINNPDKEKEYLLDLLVSGDKQIPKDNLIYLGNLPGDDLVPWQGMGVYNGYARTEWREFERKVLNQYFAWESTAKK